MFELYRTEERSEDGQLLAVCVEWTESREGLRKLVFGLMACSTIAGAITAFLITAFVQPWWACVAIGLIMMTPIVFLDKVSISGRQRMFVFHRDGHMEAPFGFQAYAARHKSVPGHHAEVKNIEARQTASHLEARETPFSHGVVLIKENGDIAYVAGRLHRDNAHKLAVQLTLALFDLREEVAADAASRSRTTDVIDAADSAALID